MKKTCNWDILKDANKIGFDMTQKVDLFTNTLLQKRKILIHPHIELVDNRLSTYLFIIKKRFCKPFSPLV